MAKKISDKTRRTQEARKKQREGYPSFYQSQIEKAHGEPCAECQKPIGYADSTNIAHILAKSTSPEVATDPHNILILCGAHHTAFDRSLAHRETMQCFEIATERYRMMKPKLTQITSETRQFEKFI